MLQQTTVKTVAPYFARFVHRWPHVGSLAAAPLQDILKEWAGLGYYARARNLHACAKTVVEQHKGRFPSNEKELLGLPGVGSYTAAAIAAIAFDQCAMPVDGNIERIVARLFVVDAPLPAAKPTIRRLAETLAPQSRAGDFAQALMDLGATICTPKKPACALCPLSDGCKARRRGDPELFPVRGPKNKGKLRGGAAFFVVRADGKVLVRSRPAKGLLGGMTEFPTTEWTADFDKADALAQAPRFFLPLPEGERSASEASRVRGFDPLDRPEPPPGYAEAKPLRLRPGEHPNPLPLGEREINWRRLPGAVAHVFTHFPLELTVYAAEIPAGTRAPEGARWVSIADLDGEALPTVMRKVAAHALERRVRPSRPSPRARWP